MESSENLLQRGLGIDNNAHAHLNETARWAKFLAIVGFVISVLLILAALFAGAFFTSLTTGMGPQIMGQGLISGLYIIVAVVYFILSLFLYRFATRMQTALLVTDQENFNNSLYNLRLVYRMMGILVLIYLGLIVLGMVIALAAAIFSAA